MKSFLTKVKRYSASNVTGLLQAESVLASYHTVEEAQAHADRWNHNYQTDTAFVEPFDPEKLDWPDRHGWNGILDD
jgi:hypothetical protein